MLFPGWMAGWKSEDEAKTHLASLGDFNGDDAAEKVIIATKTKCASAVVLHLFSQRFNSKFVSFEQDEESKIWTLKVDDDSWEHKTLAEWETWVEEEAKKKAEEAAAAAAAAAMDGAAMAEGDAMAGEMMAEEMAAE